MNMALEWKVSKKKKEEKDVIIFRTVHAMYSGRLLTIYINSTRIAMK